MGIGPHCMNMVLFLSHAGARRSPSSVFRHPSTVEVHKLPHRQSLNQSSQGNPPPLVMNSLAMGSRTKLSVSRTLPTLFLDMGKGGGGRGSIMQAAALRVGIGLVLPKSLSQSGPHASGRASLHGMPYTITSNRNRTRPQERVWREMTRRTSQLPTQQSEETQFVYNILR